MENKTVQYKRTLRGSVGAGMSALMNGSGRRFYILEHKDASRYHKAGESQKIIIDQVELGRGSNCQVKFDETFETVSRRHAAIVRENDRWKLVQLSTTNSTFLNGKRVETEWYLENGDEIQLAVNGPRLGFIVPAGKQSLVSSIKMTERLELFRKQALAPYKRAIACLTILLALAVVGLGTWNVVMQKDFNGQISEARDTIKKLIGHNAELDSLMAISLKEQARQDSLLNIYKKRQSSGKVIYPEKDKELASLLSKIEDDVFYIHATKVVITDGKEEVILPNYQWCATGFLCSDGRFVTAKHCVESWKFKGGLPTDTMAIKYLIIGLNDSNYKIITYLEARSKTRVLHFKSSDFMISRATETDFKFPRTNYVLPTEDVWHSDWAYIRTNQKGSIVMDANLSRNLPIGAELHVLGFPRGMGAIDTYNFGCLYGSCKTSRTGLDDGIIRISAKNYESGNSGGPVLYKDKGTLKAVGIVSYGAGDHNGGIVALSNLE